MIGIFELCGHILFTVVVIMVVVGDAVWLWHFLKCFGIEVCNNKKCRYRNWCFKYEEKLTEEEAQKLLELIEQL